MDPNLPNQQTSQTPMKSQGVEDQQQKKTSPKSLALLKVGMIEIFFFGIVIILFFGLLNYFNILPLSKIFPNQLGFLPQRQQSGRIYQ